MLIMVEAMLVKEAKEMVAKHTPHTKFCDKVTLRRFKTLKKIVSKKHTQHTVYIRNTPNTVIRNTPNTRSI